ncbi:MAG: TatD family hydrolase [Elusimicrobiota bacterium]|jgi:TatD DNase family protein
MLVDTHAHLGDEAFNADRVEVLRRARSSGVEWIIEIADSPKAWDSVLGFCARTPCAEEPHVRCALGIHPYSAESFDADAAKRFRRLAEDERVVAAGECGLDYARCAIPRAAQRRAFEGMLSAAMDAGLPMIVHSRNAFPETLEVLEAFYASRPVRRRFRGVLHCFSGGHEEALRAVRLGFALGADGPVTYPKNLALREALLSAGLENIVLETDAPYLPPQSSRGRRNEPAAIAEIAAEIAQVFKTTPEQVAQASTRNAEDLFQFKTE